jgi:hypothetical protein
MKNQFLKNFNKFVNENMEDQHSSPEQEDGLDLYLNYEAQDLLIASAIGCNKDEVDTYALANLSTDDESEYSNPKLVERIKSAFLNQVGKTHWTLKKPGTLVYKIMVGAPDGYTEAHYFELDGTKVVIVVMDDGPAIYAK